MTGMKKVQNSNVWWEPSFILPSLFKKLDNFGLRVAQTLDITAQCCTNKALVTGMKKSLKFK